MRRGASAIRHGRKKLVKIARSRGGSGVSHRERPLHVLTTNDQRPRARARGPKPRFPDQIANLCSRILPASKSRSTNGHLVLPLKSRRKTNQVQ